MSGWEKSAITLAVFLPTAGALVIVLVPGHMDRLIRALGILFTGAALVIGIVMLLGFDFGSGAHGLQLSFRCAIYTWKVLPPPGRPKAFLALILLLETGMAGTFIAFDLVLFFIC